MVSPGRGVEPAEGRPVALRRLPPWFKAPMPGAPGYRRLKTLMRDAELHTVCEEARCPNIGECWAQGTATFLILGDTCTRACGYCAIKTGMPQGLDLLEPDRVARTVAQMGLQHAVVTGVARDDLPEGNDHRVVTVGASRDEKIDGTDQLRGGGNGID